MSETTNNDGAGHGDGLKGAMNRAADMVGGVVGMASAATAGSHDTEAFVMNAAIGDLYEIEAGQIAAGSARSPEVREFATMMVAHHTTSMHQMESALLSLEFRVVYPHLHPVTVIDIRRLGMIEHLLESSEEGFDDRYLEQQRMAHQETATLLRGYLDHGDNPQLRSVAMGALPMVERHAKALGRIGTH